MLRFFNAFRQENRSTAFLMQYDQHLPADNAYFTFIMWWVVNINVVGSEH